MQNDFNGCNRYFTHTEKNLLETRLRIVRVISLGHFIISRPGVLTLAALNNYLIYFQKYISLSPYPEIIRSLMGGSTTGIVI